MNALVTIAVGGTAYPLSALIIADPETGRLTWVARPRAMFADEGAFKSWNTRYAGKPALATLNSAGYLHGAIGGKSVIAHRVAYALYHGVWPQAEVDHINGNRTDNRRENLRDVTVRENRRNQTRSRANTSGVTGVHYCNTWKRWIAKIMVGRRSRTIGNYATFDEAVAARAAANKSEGFHEGHGKERVA